MSLFGVLNVHKPAGLTSRAVVDRVERLIRPVRAGHAGTLDPLATGVLVICVGQATRLIQYVQRMPKTYHATFLLGHRSETDDVEGEVVPVDDAPTPTRESVDNVLNQFIGEIQQRPPAHSAVKLAGRRAYKLARRGVAVEIAPRTITIHSIAVRRYQYPELELDIECGSGTYVRSLGRDLGAALGTAAVMSALERTAIGRFRIQDAIALDDLTAETLSQHLQPALTIVDDLPRVALSKAQLLEIRNGRPILSSWLTSKPSPFGEGQVARDSPRRGEGAMLPLPLGEGRGEGVLSLAVVDATGRLIALLYEKQPGELWPAMNFGA
jgi:tRNA pseudouridine55 synthase